MTKHARIATIAKIPYNTGAFFNKHMNKWKQSVILSLGGSLVVPNGGVSIPFLAEFNTFIRRHIKDGRRFFIIVGGGGTCRRYQDAAKEVHPNVSNEDLDWLGIHTTRANAHLVRTIFQDIARPRVFDRYDRKEELGDYPVVIGAGWKPGFSTDYDSVALCNFYGARLVINMTNTEKVYTKDPRKFKDAQALDLITWSKYRLLIGDKWSPGLSTPFDPVASKLADELGITVVVLDGTNLPNVENAILGKKFIGTTIEN